MNKNLFLSRLKENLKHLPKEDREDALRYYQEYFEEMGATEDYDVTVELGTPEQVAKTIIAECTQKRIDTQKKQGGIKSSAMVVWMIILAIFASPIAIPIAIVLVTLLFVALIVLFSLLIAIVSTGVALFCGGIFLVIGMFMVGGVAQGIVCAGIGCVCLGVGLLILLASIKFGELCVRIIAAIFKSIFLRKKEA